MAKSPKSKKRNANNVKRLHRLILPFFYWRYHEDDNDGPLITHRGYRGPTTPTTMDEMEYQVQNTSFFWQCVTITYCRDLRGKEYRQFGFGKTNQTLKVVDVPIEPLLTATLNYAEKNLNARFIYARGVVIAPWSKQHKDMIPAISKVKKKLHLTDQDIDDIKDYLDVTPEYYESTYHDIDDEIGQLLKEPTHDEV